MNENIKDMSADMHTDPGTSDYESDPELDYTIGGTPRLYVESVKVIKETKDFIQLEATLILTAVADDEGGYSGKPMSQRARSLGRGQKCMDEGYNGTKSQQTRGRSQSSKRKSQSVVSIFYKPFYLLSLQSPYTRLQKQVLFHLIKVG